MMEIGKRSNKSFLPIDDEQKNKRCNTVRRRCLIFLSYLKNLGYSNEIPIDTAKNLFSQILDLWDRLTLKAYFGTQEHKSTRKIQRIARYDTGTYSFKNIELSQEVKTKKGYLEKLGLVSFHRKGSIWFLKVENPVLIPQLIRNHSEIIKNLSLTPIPFEYNQCKGIGEGETSLSYASKLETNNNLQSERDKFYSDVIKAELSDTDLSLLKAKPSEEPDRVKVSLGNT